MTSYVIRRKRAPSLLDQAYAILRKGEKAPSASEEAKEPAPRTRGAKRTEPAKAEKKGAKR